MRYSVSLSDCESAEILEIGAKAHSLAVLLKNGFDVPAGFALTVQAFFKFLEDNRIDSQIAKSVEFISESNLVSSCQTIRDLMIQAAVPDEILSEELVHLERLAAKLVAVRSSSVGEDSASSSFAGLHDTYLNVPSNPPLVSECVKRCWASLFNERAMAYRVMRHLPLCDGMAVLIQEMVAARVAGVAFSSHPLEENVLIIEAAGGLGDSVVSGSIKPDRYIVDRTTLKLLRKEIVPRQGRASVGEEEIGREAIQDEEMFGVLSSEKVAEVAHTCLSIEELFGRPQDIEWCLHDSKLHVLQARPITVVSNRESKGGML